MTTKEIIEMLRVCADDDIICPACQRYEQYEYGGTAECFEKLMQEAADALEAALREQEERRWIPVTERFPDLIPCSAGTEYSEAVNVLTSGRKVLTAIWDGTDFLADADFWDADGEEITHWTPVLLPLPEPPKEDAP